VHLVIGAAGYAGRQVVAALGDLVRVRTAELGDDLAGAMRGAEVVHLAFELRSPFEWHRARRGPDPFLVSLVRRAREAGVRRLVCLSSAHVIGVPREGRVSERTRPEPGQPYARALAADEAWLREQYDPDVVVLRPAQGFGPGEPLLTRLLERMLIAGLPLPGGGAARGSFLAGADLGGAFHAAALRGEPGGAYLLGGVDGTWRELLCETAQALGVEPRVRRRSYDLAYLGASVGVQTSAGRACWPTPFLVEVIGRPLLLDDGWTRRELSWAPRATTFAAGLRGLADWQRETAAATAAAGRARSAAYRTVM
jgi:nucleoside-diphosphate-sugar epimerase